MVGIDGVLQEELQEKRAGRQASNLSELKYAVLIPWQVEQDREQSVSMVEFEQYETEPAQEIFSTLKHK